MNETHIQRCDRLRASLLQLSDMEDDLKGDLLRCIDAFEKEPQTLEQIEELATDNERQKKELARLRQFRRSQTADSMSSKLREALRE